MIVKKRKLDIWKPTLKDTKKKNHITNLPTPKYTQLGKTLVDIETTQILKIEMSIISN